ncbi:MAG: universal stress protein [Myxococcales bacterium]|nr:universal stress protein [Myxococcales bacterium]
MTLRRILVPVDFSACSDLALDWARSVSGAETEITVLHVWEAPAYSGMESLMVVHEAGKPNQTLNEYVHGQAKKELDAQVERARSRGVKIAAVELVAGAPDDVVVRRSEEFDLVVMGTHGRGLIAHLLVGSVAERVVRKAKCAVLTVREAQNPPKDG